MIRFYLICVLSGLCAAAPAEAGPPPAPVKPGTAAQYPCADDLARLCKAVPAGAGRKFACLDAHKSKLRPACQTFVEALDARYVQMAAQRHETVAKFLADAYDRYHTGVKVRPGIPTKPKEPQ